MPADPAPSTQRWGVGVEGSLSPADIAELAHRADISGYASFWVNIVPGISDPTQILLALAEAGTRIDVGIGVVPVDRYRVAGIVAEGKSAGLSWERVVFGIGGGHTKQGMLAQLASSINTLRDIEPRARIGVAGYGPKVLELGGRLADALCLAWMTPEGLGWARNQANAGAVRAQRPDPPIYAYVRCAIGHDAVARIEAEVAKNERYAWYTQHRERMGAALLGVALATAEDAWGALRAYAAHSEPVLRPIMRNSRDIGEWREAIEVLAPPRDPARQSERR